MTFQDIFKSSFLENIASISILDMVIAMVLAFLLGLFIFFTQTSHTQNGIRTLKNQYFSPQSILK